ncbi:hypothetical protein NDU88_007188 [Pleurodeles waltl]|uniref:Uncharacterized protein n=1 Tax=Pleurodeles waltl TaxID=8319 RepID=A0AAV7QLA9_PLEWA|nr:hypothetical protein NDU88_007188 [Pleurodeles waltl]
MGDGRNSSRHALRLSHRPRESAPRRDALWRLGSRKECGNRLRAWLPGTPSLSLDCRQFCRNAEALRAASHSGLRLLGTQSFLSSLGQVLAKFTSEEERGNQPLSPGTLLSRAEATIQGFSQQAQ